MSSSGDLTKAVAVCLRRRTITQERYLTPAPAKWTQSGPGPRTLSLCLLELPRVPRVWWEFLSVAGPRGRPGHWLSRHSWPGSGSECHSWPRSRTLTSGSGHRLSLVLAAGPTLCCANLVLFYVMAACEEWKIQLYTLLSLVTSKTQNWALCSFWLFYQGNEICKP